VTCEQRVISPATGIQAAVDHVDTLAHGAQVADGKEMAVHFGTNQDGPTDGAVPNAVLSPFSVDGQKLSISNDVDSFAAVVDSNDGASGQALTPGDVPGADPVLISKEVLFDNFNDTHEAEDPAIVEGRTRWDKLVTHSQN